MKTYFRTATVAVLLSAALIGGVQNAAALDKIRAGKAVAADWGFLPLDIGKEMGIYAKYGIDLDIVSFAGDAKLVQGLNSDSVDVGLASGPAMAFSAKGAAMIAVAAFDGAPRNFAVIVGPDSPLHSMADLRGKQIAVTTVGSLTEWLGKRIALTEGWGADGLHTVALGAPDAELAALRTHQVDGVIAVTQLGYVLEDKKEGRILAILERYAPKCHSHVIEVRTALIADKPELVDRFLKGFFASIAFMKANKAKTSEIAQCVLNQSATVVDRTYDNEIGILIADGQFDPQAIATLKESFTATGMLTESPPDSQLYTTRFLPVKP
jgi:NitT/TauT family transport system substrate-binding protein